MPMATFNPVLQFGASRLRKWQCTNARTKEISLYQTMLYHGLHELKILWPSRSEL